MKEAIRVEGLTKAIGGRRILDGVSFAVQEGEIVGLVGENGAGKSSLLKCLTGLWRPDAGRVAVFGREIAAGCGYLEETGALIEYPALFGEYTLAETIELFSAFCPGGKERAARLVSRLGLEEGMKRKVATFSSGMKQKACLVAVLMRSPRLLILDEPTAMLDPKISLELRSLIREYHQSYHTTILISGHDLSEIETLCSRVLKMKAGKIVSEFDLSHSPERVYRLKFADRAQAAAALSRTANANLRQEGESLYFRGTGRELSGLLTEYRFELSDLTVCNPLESLFEEGQDVRQSTLV